MNGAKSVVIIRILFLLLGSSPYVSVDSATNAMEHAYPRFLR